MLARRLHPKSHIFSRAQTAVVLSRFACLRDGQCCFIFAPLRRERQGRDTPPPLPLDTMLASHTWVGVSSRRLSVRLSCVGVGVDLILAYAEEMDDTGEKVLYLCLEKAVDMEALASNNMPGDWEGVLEGEEPLNLYYPDKDKVSRVWCCAVSAVRGLGCRVV